MPRSQNRRTEEPGKTPDDASDDKLIPKWVKTAGAIVAIIVTISGGIAGLSQIVISLKNIDYNIEKERHATEQARAQAAAEDRKKAEVEAKRSLGEADAQDRLKEKDLELKRADVQKETLARDALQLNIEKDIEEKRMDLQAKIDDRNRQQVEASEAKFKDTLLGVFKPVDTLPELAKLTEYTTPQGERLNHVLTPLMAKLHEVNRPAEVSIIFQLFEKAGPSSISFVIDSNRNALEGYKANAKKLALLQFDLDRQKTDSATAQYDLLALLERSTSTLMSIQEPQTGLAELQRAIIEDVWDQIISSLGGRRGYRALQQDNKTLDVTGAELHGIRLPLAHGEIEIERIRHETMLQLWILRQSKRSLARLLGQTLDSVDLSGADLSGIRLPQRQYGSIDFSEAFVPDADFSAALLDPPTVRSLAEAYVSRGQKVLHQPQLLRLSRQQYQWLLGSRSGTN